MENQTERNMDNEHGYWDYAVVLGLNELLSTLCLHVDHSILRVDIWVPLVVSHSPRFIHSLIGTHVHSLDGTS